MNAHRQFRPGDRVPGTVYRVDDLVGSGGMGSVYRVEHTELGKAFVLKALHGHLSTRDDLVARLRNEWRALAKLDHPNIVQVTDAGRTQEGLPFYVMESLEGVTLSALLAREGRLGVQRSFAIISGVLSGLHAAHQTGAIHRDIKPPNIFVQHDGQTKLLDFGIAKLRDKAAKVVTAGGISIGTPRYMAPEQAEGTKVDARADIYATGLVLYEMLVGKGPFAHIRDPNQLVMAHISKEPERADFIKPDIPEEAGDLLQRWLSKSPDSRPATAELARQELEALARALPGDPADSADDVTLAGAYDAATVGAEGSLAVSSPPALGEVAIEAETSKVEMTPREVTQTQTVAEPERGERVSEPVGPAGTMGWGSHADLAEETRVPAALSEKGDQVSVESGDQKRRSVTPPPISSSRPSKAPPRNGPSSSLKWALGTAAVSFAVALGVSQLLTGANENTESSPAAPAPRASEPLKTPEPASPRPESALAESAPAESAPTEPAIDPRPEAPQPDDGDEGEDEAKKPEIAQNPSKPAPKPRTAPPLPTERPKASPRPVPRPSGTKKPAKSLPGSGLW